MKCPNCSHWNRVPVNKAFIGEANQIEPVKILIPMCEPLELTKCKKCGKVMAEPKELGIARVKSTCMQDQTLYK